MQLPKCTQSCLFLPLDSALHLFLSELQMPIKSVIVSTEAIDCSNTYALQIGVPCHMH